MGLQAVGEAMRTAAPAAPEERLEPALRELVARAGAMAGAVALYDPAERMLRLAAEVGLSDEGCRLLRALGPDAAWNLPLAAVWNEHACVVAATAGLPPLVAGDMATATVACVPLGTGATPRGCAILVADAAAGVDEDRLRALGPALAVVEDVVEAILQRATAVLAPGTPGGALAAVTGAALGAITPVAREVGRLLRAAGARLPGGMLLDGLAPDPGDASRVARAERAAALLRAECRRLEDDAAAREAEVAERLAAGEAELAATRERLHTLRAERDRLAAEMTGAAGREEALRGQLAAAVERAAADREAAHRRLHEQAAEAERQRAATVADLERTRAAMARLDAALIEATEKRRAAEAERARLAASAHGAAVARRQAELAADEARAREATAAARTHALEDELAGARRDARRHEDALAALEARWQSRLVEAERSAAAERQALETLRREHAAVVDEAAAAAAREARLAQELDALRRQRSADRDDLLARARELARETEAARAAAVAELEAVREELAEAQALVLHVQERQGSTADGAAAREETLRYALDMQQQSEEARTAAVAETEAVRAALAGAQQVVLAAEETARTAEAEAARLGAVADEAQAERARAQAAVEEALAREAETAARTGALERELWDLREACRKLELSAHEREAAARGAAEATLARAEDEATRARAAARELEAQLAARAGELAESRGREQRAGEALAALREQAASEREAAVRQALALGEAAERARAAAATEAEALRTVLADVQVRILAAEDQARAAAAEAERLAAAEAQARTDRERLAGELAATRERASEVAAHLAAAEARLAVLEPHRRSEPADGAQPRPPAVRRAARGTVAVLDTGALWADASTDRIAVETLPPSEDLAARLRGLAPDRVLANLAAPGVFAALLALREAGCPARFTGCVAVADHDGVLLLGPIEPARRPFDPEVLLAFLTAHGIRGTRVLAVGADAGTMIGLRHALVRVGRRVSIAWDAKQAGELLPMVRPEIAVVDLRLPPRGGHAVVADLAVLVPPPLTVLLARDDDPAADFAAALAEPHRTPHVLAAARAVAATLDAPGDTPVW